MTDKPSASVPQTSSLAEMVLRAGKFAKGIPPVDLWEPAFCGDIDMEIKRDGTWFYLGSPIGRPAMVQLFSSVLRKDDDGQTYLVTPVEKLGIRVEDAHFVAVELEVASEGKFEQVLTVRTHIGDVIEIGASHGLRFEIEPEHGGLKPYIHVRGRLEALASRPVMFQLTALGEDIEFQGRMMFAIRSGGVVFPIIESSALAQLAETA